MPKWKGFGYAYTRWRPGMGFVVCFLVLFTALMHYIVMRMNYARDSKKVEYFTEAALRQARGSNRKVRVPFYEGSNQSLELVVEDGWVYLVCVAVAGLMASGALVAIHVVRRFTRRSLHFWSFFVLEN